MKRFMVICFIDDGWHGINEIFVCGADTAEHALKQALNAYPKSEEEEVYELVRVL